MVRTRAGATTRARPPAKRKAPAARRPAKRAKAPATPPPTRLRTATCAACLDAAGPRSVVCGARAHRLCVACAERHINSLPLRGPHGLPGSPDAEAWATRQWAPFCAFCGDGKHRLERFSTKAAEAQLKTHALAHVSERAAKAKAAEAKKAEIEAKREANVKEKEANRGKKVGKSKYTPKEVKELKQVFDE